MKHRPYLSSTHDLLSGKDWSNNPLGDPASWPLSLRNYVSMVMAMPTPAIIFWGPELNQIYNDGYAQIMGPRHPRFFGEPYRDCWPDTYPLIYPWMRRVLDDAEVIEVDRELIPLTRFGFEEDAYFTFTLTALRDDQGRIAGIFQPVFEVTDSVLAERRARLLRNLSGLTGEETLWPAAIAALEMAKGDIPHASVWQEAPDGSATRIAATAGDRGDERVPPLVAEALRTGRPAWTEDRRSVAQPLATGDVQAARTVLLAHTSERLHATGAYLEFLEMVAVELSSALHRAQAAGAQERQRAFLQRLFMQAPAGIAVLRGPQHVFELTNSMYQGLIGQRDVVGLPLVEALPELAGQPFVDHLDDVYRTGEPYVGLAELAVLQRTPDSPPEDVYFNFVYQPLLGEDRAGPQGILVFCYEVTEQVLARQDSERLAQALQLEHLRKDEFLAMLAHELRNPLAPVRSAADLLLRAPGNEALVRRASQTISRQVGHMSGLVNDLLEVSRVTRGLVELERQPQDLVAVLQEASEQVRPLVEARTHELRLDMPGHPVLVNGDHKRLVQIFSNLLNNAAKYTPDRGHITLRLELRDGQAVVAVADNGIGLDAELLPRVFDLFVQGQRGAARAEGGLGIGLALVRSLVQMHGGSVNAHSAGGGQGSRFEVVLPLLVEDAAAGARERKDDQPLRGQGQRVLVVDDNTDAAQMLALQMQHIGYEVDVVYSGRAALDACAQHEYAACLIDIGLPDLKGTEVAGRLKARPGRPAPLLVAVSGYGQATDVRSAREAGFDHYQVKPVDIVPLSRVLAAKVPSDTTAD